MKKNQNIYFNLLAFYKIKIKYSFHFNKKFFLSSTYK
jgi:hypothetical protein